MLKSLFFPTITNTNPLMRETRFIEQNQEKWEEFEQILDSDAKKPEKLYDLFIQITDDLSHARTFYPNRSVRVFLNGLAQQIFFRLYKTKRIGNSRLVRFWTDELPHLVYESRRAFLFSGLVFLLAILIGVLSSAMDSEFAETILGESYVNMTIENIESGDPMAVYKQRGAFGMSMGITANNLFVAFLTFAMGAFFSIGSLMILISNGIMVGAFQYFFIERGLFWESFLTIWTHGTLEISAIIIAGAAGLTMGQGLVFPGTLTRTEAFQLSARRGLKIMIGITPIIIIAGFIEGFLTRLTHTPDYIRLLFILLCLAFVVLYFGWYPRQKAKTGFLKPLNRSLPPSRPPIQPFFGILSNGNILGLSFRIIKENLLLLLNFSVSIATVYSLLVFLSSSKQPTELMEFPYSMFASITSLPQFFFQDAFFWITPLALFAIATMIWAVSNISFKVTHPKDTSTWNLLGYGNFVLLSLLGFLIAWISGWWIGMTFLVSLPILLLWATVYRFESISLFSAFGRTLQLMNGGFSKLLGSFLLTILLASLCFTLLDTSLSSFFLELISWVVYFEASVMQEVSVVIFTVVTFAAFLFMLAFLQINISILYFSLVEIKDAPDLAKAVKQVGLRKQLRGLDIE